MTMTWGAFGGFCGAAALLAAALGTPLRTVLTLTPLDRTPLVLPAGLLFMSSVALLIGSMLPLTSTSGHPAPAAILLFGGAGALLAYLAVLSAAILARQRDVRVLSAGIALTVPACVVGSGALIHVAALESAQVALLVTITVSALWAGSYPALQIHGTRRHVEA
ncbi:hypothetical protein [Plantibacter sp. YIM 135249]|uniref:hypothetical protein n=1 Tax=Plantibacter sp. YIM 135249 TaxID=3423918 RepID=UPI003D34C09C